MRTMNNLLIICMVAFGISCSETEVDNEELVASNYQFSLEQQPQYLNGLELYKQGAVVNHFRTKQQIAELKELIDGGQKNLLPKLEAAQQKEAALVEYKMDLVSLKAPTGGKFPPRPPRGCWDDPNAGCIPKLNISDFAGIEITEGLQEAQVEIKNAKNQLVGRGGKVSHIKGGLKVIALDADFTGDATMYITPKNDLGKMKIVLEIPVIRN